MPAKQTFIVADDLTGSADSALPFWRAGRRVIVVFDPASIWPENPGVLSLCTHSRAMSEADAQQAVASIARCLPTGSTWFKKIDSTLRGWVGAESTALLTAQPERQPVFAPAYPTNGRTLQPDGRYRVHGVPIAETEFAAEISGLDADSRLSGYLRRHFGEFAPRVRLVPAVTNEDLRDAVDSIAEPALWIGSPGLGIALAGPNSRPAPPAPAPSQLASAPIVVAAGSRRTLTQRQIATLQAAVTGTTSSPLQLLRVPDAAYEPARALVLADELGARAAAAAQSLGSCGLILTGGDIAAAACRHLGIASAEIVGEVEDGLPVLRAGRFVFVTKAGGFGDEQSLVRAYRRLSQFLT